ncbi:MAG: cytochrome c [Rhodospirillaceae bacterium]|nr:cytochrome c [Rhodospirillaceae bacterium]
MKINASALFVGGFLVLGLGVAIWKVSGSSEAEAPPPLVVEVPQLSFQAKRGEKAFNNTCAQCHGKNASGTEQGPPLIHDIYNPGHHADEAIRRAVKLGVRRHHWSFGDMPRQEHVKPSEIETIIVYIRELQTANAIVTRPHSM